MLAPSGVRFLGEAQKLRAARSHGEIFSTPLSARNLLQKIVPHLAEPLRMVGALRERLFEFPALLTTLTCQEQDVVIDLDGPTGPLDHSAIAP